MRPVFGVHINSCDRHVIKKNFPNSLDKGFCRGIMSTNSKLPSVMRRTRHQATVQRGRKLRTTQTNDDSPPSNHRLNPKVSLIVLPALKVPSGSHIGDQSGWNREHVPVPMLGTGLFYIPWQSKGGVFIMAKINVSLPDGSKREFEAGISCWILQRASTRNWAKRRFWQRSTV